MAHPLRASRAPSRERHQRTRTGEAGSAASAGAPPAAARGRGGSLRPLLTDLAFGLAFFAIAGGVGWAFWPQ